jgi:hypothetical protein
LAVVWVPDRSHFDHVNRTRLAKLSKITSQLPSILSLNFPKANFRIADDSDINGFAVELLVPNQEQVKI